MSPTCAAPVGADCQFEQALQDVPGVELASVLQSVARSVKDIAEMLRVTDMGEAGTTNSFGDDQLQMDLVADDIIFARLRSCPAVASASSEERPEIVDLRSDDAAASSSGGSSMYSVAFDPLDGSSILSANFAVGSIFGIWPGKSPIGSSGRDQSAAAYAIYGPRTLLVVARPSLAAGGALTVQEFVLGSSGAWQMRRTIASLANKSNCAPANMRAAARNLAYKQLLDTWVHSGYKLRYSGGMVPDVHHILAKGGGVFCNPASDAAPPKLRLLYECAPLAFVIEAAGGMSSDGRSSILDLVIYATSARTTIALGSRQQVEACVEALQGGGAAGGGGSGPAQATPASAHAVTAAAAR